MSELNTYWVENKTERDLLISDLGIKIPAGQSVDIFKLKPGLNKYSVAVSETKGNLRKCYDLEKLIRLVSRPKQEQLPRQYRISTKPVQRHRRSMVVVDNSKEDTIEELSNFDEDNIARFAEGINDPVSKEFEGFEDDVVVMDPGEEEFPPRSEKAAQTEIQSRQGYDGKSGRQKSYFVVDVVDDDGNEVADDRADSSVLYDVPVIG